MWPRTSCRIPRLFDGHFQHRTPVLSEGPSRQTTVFLLSPNYLSMEFVFQTYGGDGFDDLFDSLARQVEYLFFQIVSLKFSNAAQLNDDGALLRRDKMGDAGRNDDETARRVTL